MSIWDTQRAYTGLNGDLAKFAVFADGPDSRICIRAVDTIAGEKCVIAMSADQAVDFARDLLDAAMALQEEQAGEQ